LIPSVRWHTVIQYFFIFIAYTSGTYAISKHRYGIGLSLAAVLSTFYEMYVSLQYTKTAAFMTAVGLVMIYEYVRDAKAFDRSGKTVIQEPGRALFIERKVFAILGIIYMIYGALLRPEAFLIACIPMFFVGCLELTRTRLVINYVITLVPTFALVVFFIFINNLVYSSDADWSEFMTYNKARMQLTDYRHDLLHYPTNGEKLAELGISENDAMLIVTYQFGDDEVFDTSCMETIADSFDIKALNLQVFKNLWENIGIEIMRMTVILPALFLLIILLICTIISERSRSDAKAISEARMKLLAMLCMGLLCAMALIYFQYSGRWSHRLVGALVIPTIYSICYMLDSSTLQIEDRGIIFGGNVKDRAGIFITIIIMLSIGVSGLNCINNRNDYIENRAVIEEKNQVTDYFVNNKETLFVIDTFTFQNSFKYDVFTAYEEGSFDNVVSCGSWFMNSPITKKVCNKYGYTNPYDALLDSNGSAVLLDTYFPNEKALFLTEHYGKLYNAVNVGSIGSITEFKMESLE